MTSQFIRVVRTREQKEVLINVNSIWKIEVSYVMKGETDHEQRRQEYGTVPLNLGAESPDAIRMYKVFFGNDEAVVVAVSTDPVMQALEDIYKTAVKG